MLVRSDVGFDVGAEQVGVVAVFRPVRRVGVAVVDLRRERLLGPNRVMDLMQRWRRRSSAVAVAVPKVRQAPAKTVADSTLNNGLVRTRSAGNLISEMIKRCFHTRSGIGDLIVTTSGFLQPVPGPRPAALVARTILALPAPRRSSQSLRSGPQRQQARRLGGCLQLHLRIEKQTSAATGFVIGRRGVLSASGVMLFACLASRSAPLRRGSSDEPDTVGRDVCRVALPERDPGWHRFGDDRRGVPDADSPTAERHGRRPSARPPRQRTKAAASQSLMTSP